MPMPWNVAENPLAGERFVFTGTAGDALVFDFFLAPNGGIPDVHVHASQDEVFRCTSGTLTVTMGGAKRTLRPGDTLVIPRGTPHSFANSSAEECRCEVEYSPAGRNEAWFKLLGAAAKKYGRPPKVLEIAPFIGDVDIFLAGIPIAVQRVLFGVLRPIAIALGHKRRMLDIASEAYGRRFTW